MSPVAYVTAVIVGAGLVGLWLACRLARLTPRSGRGAAFCFALAWLIPGFASPLLQAAMRSLPLGAAIFFTVFPVFVVTFALIAWALRYLAQLAGHAVR